MDINFPALYWPKSRKTKTSKENIDELHNMLEELQEFKTNIILKYSISYTRSTIVENIQGLIDFVKARVKKKKSYRKRIGKHCQKIESIFRK